MGIVGRTVAVGGSRGSQYGLWRRPKGRQKGLVILDGKSHLGRPFRSEQRNSM